MFRRKGEDSLFDTPNDQQGADIATAEQTAGTAATTAPSSPVSSAAPLQTPPSGQPNSPLARSSAPENRAELRPENRPTASQPGAFRPASAPMGSDMGRNRMPETKPTAASSSMGMSMSVDKSKGGRRVLTVGNDILLKGEIATCDRLVIEGKVDATLNDVHTVEISETGSFKGSANIEDAEISGLFEGDLVVRNRLVIYATGKVRGKITYGEIEIERGGELTGEIKTNAQAGGATAARPATRKEDKMVAA